MKKISFILRNDPELLSNKIFESAELYGMKSDNYPFKALRDSFKAIGYDLSTYDINSPKDSEFIICLDEVATFNRINTFNKLSYLILAEPPVYILENWDIVNHEKFEKIFSYNDDIILNDKYVKYYFPIDFSDVGDFAFVSEDLYQKRKLSCIIAGSIQISKSNTYANSLLYERFLITSWFGKYHPSDLSFYGRNINPKKFEEFSGITILRKFKLGNIIKLIAKSKSKYILKCFKGSIPPLEKLSYLNKYNFSFCFENSRLNGCISEKIFDCFFAKTVPIYLGAPNIDEFIPESCYINKNDFKNNDELYDFVKNISYKDYSAYLSAAREFLDSDKSESFKVKSYTDTILAHIKTS